MMGYVEEPKRVLERKARGSLGFGGSAIASPTSSHWLCTGLDSKAWLKPANFSPHHSVQPAVISTDFAIAIQTHSIRYYQKN